MKRRMAALLACMLCAGALAAPAAFGAEAGGTYTHVKEALSPAAGEAAQAQQHPRIVPYAEYPDWEGRYQAALAAYYQAAAAGGLHWLATAERPEDFTYAFCDIDSNGTAELVKSAFGVFEVYTLAGDTPVLIASGGYRSGDIEIGETGLLRQFGSDSAVSGGGEYWRLIDGGLGRAILWRVVYESEMEGFAGTRYTVTDADGNETVFDERGFAQWGDQSLGWSGHWPGERIINDALAYKPITQWAAEAGQAEASYAAIIEEYRQAVLAARSFDPEHGYEYIHYLFDWQPLAETGYVSVKDDVLWEHFGYAYRDLNGDGRPELILLTKDYEIPAIYTLIDGWAPKWFGPYGGEDTCFLNADDTVTIVINMPEELHVGNYRLSDWGDEWVRLGFLEDHMRFVRVGDEQYEHDHTYTLIDADGRRETMTEEAYRASPLWPDRDQNRHVGLVFIPLFDGQPEGMAASPETASPQSALPQSALPQPWYGEKVTLTGSQTANIRSGPGVQHRQIGEAYPGASFYYTGVMEGGFYQILYPSPQEGHVTAYVAQSLAVVSPALAEDVILSSVVGHLTVRPGTDVYLDAGLARKLRDTLSGTGEVAFAGVTPDGTYAVVFGRAGGEGALIQWIGFIAPEDVLQVSWTAR